MAVVAQAERRVADLEARAAELKPGLTERQRLTQERFVALLVQRREIPPTLRAQFRRLPPEPPLHPAVQALCERVMEKDPALPGR